MEQEFKNEYYFENGVLHIRGFKKVAWGRTGGPNPNPSGIDTLSNMVNFRWARKADGSWKYPVVFDPEYYEEDTIRIFA